MKLGKDIKKEMKSQFENDIILPVQVKGEIEKRLNKGFFGRIKALIVSKKMENSEKIHDSTNSSRHTP